MEYSKTRIMMILEKRIRRNSSINIKTPLYEQHKNEFILDLALDIIAQETKHPGTIKKILEEDSIRGKYA